MKIPKEYFEVYNWIPTDVAGVKSPTPFQMRVYNLCQQVPAGKVATYKDIAIALKSSPRAVGQALRNNPFAPAPIPCHRVIANNHFIGGYCGTWGNGKQIDRKLQFLLKEGIEVDNDGFLAVAQRKSAIFRTFNV